MYKHLGYVVAGVLSLMLLQGCTEQVDPAKIQADVTKAQADGQKLIVDAQAKLDQVVAANNKDIVGSQADAQRAAATDPSAPPPAADEAVAKARQHAAVMVADAQLEVDKAKAEAPYNVAVAQCGSQLSDAKKTCESQAKATYDLAVAAAKTKHDQALVSH
ncbi:MAG: hypothetical protein ABI304_13155 [Rudaea sp.]